SPFGPTISGGVPAGSSGAQLTGSAAPASRSRAEVVSELWYRSYDGVVFAWTSPSHSAARCAEVPTGVKLILRRTPYSRSIASSSRAIVSCVNVVWIVAFTSPSARAASTTCCRVAASDAGALAAGALAAGALAPPGGGAGEGAAAGPQARMRVRQATSHNSLRCNGPSPPP